MAEAVALLTETLGFSSRHSWHGWLAQLEDMISSPDDELGRLYLRLLPYRRALLGWAD